MATGEQPRYARAAAGSGICLTIAAVGVLIGFSLDPDTSPGPYKAWAPLAMGSDAAAIIAAVCIMVCGAVTWWDQRLSRRQAEVTARARGA